MSAWKMRSFIVYVLVVIIMSDCVASMPMAKDVSFYQEVSHKQLFSGVDTGVVFPGGSLPFKQSVALAFDKNNQCFLNIDALGALWSSQRTLSSARSDESSSRLDSPFGDWHAMSGAPSELAALATDINVSSDGSGIKLVHADSSFLVAGPTAVIEFTIDIGCSKVLEWHYATQGAD